jgi:hypothetical protein
MPEIIVMLAGVILLVTGVTVVGLVRAGMKRKRIAAEQARPLTGYELHRKRWLETGDPQELDLMNHSLEE